MIIEIVLAIMLLLMVLVMAVCHVLEWFCKRRLKLGLPCTNCPLMGYLCKQVEFDD